MQVEGEEEKDAWICRCWIKVRFWFWMIVIFVSHPVYNEKWIKAKLKEFNGVLNTNFLGCQVPREGVHYTYTACIIIDSVMKIEKRIIHKFI